MMFFLFFDLKVGGFSHVFFEELPVRVVAASCLEDLLSREDQEAGIQVFLFALFLEGLYSGFQ